MRNPEDEIKLRSLMNNIVTRYNARNNEVVEMHAYGVDFDFIEADIRHVWKTYFSSGEADASDHDILVALKSFEYVFWPRELYLEAALVISEITKCPVATMIEPERLIPESRFLLDYLDDQTSQAGENGVITRIFDIMGKTNSWCVEFGAWDGKLHSNTYDLVTNNGWNGVLIEAKEKRFDELVKTHQGNDRAHPINQMIGFDPHSDSIDYILGTTEIPQSFDLMIVDIDGNDWHVWHSMQTYRPRLVMVELNPTIPNDVLYIQERNAEQQRGCSLRALIDLGKSKGYELVCATSFNGLFVVSEEFEKFGITDNSIDAMYTPVMDGRIFHGFDSSVHIVGMPKLMWDWRGHGRDWSRDLPDQFNVYKEW